MIPAAFAIAALLLAAISLRRATWIAAGAYIASMLLVALAVLAAMGTARPEWVGHRQGIVVLSMALVEGQAIYVWTRDGNNPPVAFALPWDEKRAEELQKALREAARRGQQAHWGTQDGKSGKPASGSADGNPFAHPHHHEFHVAPITPLPPKVTP